MGYLALYFLPYHRMTVFRFIVGRYALGACLLCLVLSSCQRASYVFQPPQRIQVPQAEESPPVAFSRERFPKVRPPAASIARFRRPASNARPHRPPRRPTSCQRVAIRLVPGAKLQPLSLRWVRPEVAAQRLEVPAPGRHFSKGLAVALAILLGIFGAHLFYLGDRYRARRCLFITLACLAVAALGASVVALSVSWAGLSLGLALLIGGAAGLVMVYLWALLDAARILGGGLEPVDGKF